MELKRDGNTASTKDPTIISRAMWNRSSGPAPVRRYLPKLIDMVLNEKINPGKVDYAQSNIRINAVCPEIIDTPMMDRFSGGTTEGRQAVIAQEPATSTAEIGWAQSRRSLQ